MGVRVVFPDMGKDPSVQLIEKTITENGTYDAITDGANGFSKVNVNVEGGGGGSSDFSTAEVTLTNETMFALALAYIDNTNGVSSQMGQSGVYDAVLYKGKATGVLLAPSASASVTGNITYNDYEFVITGDGTITISE